MLLDLITLGRFSAELHAAWQGRRLNRAGADGSGMSLEVHGAPGHSLQVSFGPPGRIRLGSSPVREEPGDRSLRYLVGARVESVSCQEGDRVLRVRLRRSNPAGDPTYGVLLVMLIPPRYRLCLVGERHGRILGAWAAGGDRRAPRIGDLQDLQIAADRRDPASMEREDWEALLAGPGTLEEALRRSLAGMDRHFITRLCADAGVAPKTALSDCPPDAAEELRRVSRRLHEGPHPHAFRWSPGGGWVRVSLLEPLGRAGVESFASVSEALQAPVAEPDRSPPGGGQRARLRRALGLLERRRAALQSDLDEAGRVDHLERAAHSLMASGESAARGPRRLEVADVHDPEASATIVVELERGRSAPSQAGRMLKRARRFRRRLEVLPPRLQRLREQLGETRALLDRLEEEGVNQLPEEEMERWERSLGLARAAEGASPGGERSAAHPRRYRTTSGWSVWAGRNNRENDLLTHRLAAQNDLWFHARGYAGSHVILRREGRKDEPSRKTLEEAAAVAAWWSKGRTANKVPVIYTLAKHVSRPRGGSPGLASVRREKSLMVRPGLLPGEEDG